MSDAGPIIYVAVCEDGTVDWSNPVDDPELSDGLIEGWHWAKARIVLEERE